MNIIYIGALILLLIGFYAIIFKDNLLKKIFGYALLGDGVNLLLIALGYKYGGIPPSITEEYIGKIEVFASKAVDPLPPALVITAIVIGLSVIAALLALAINVYRVYGTLNVKKVRRLRG
ncbi:MAG: sodium:proton antiporter [Nitrososphaerota archaeon]|nr:sodium:proton antiporter [Nitrososphaerales archaeon]MCX8191965.1 sodium:proton antiporter [Nitrososphaerales archaeon]MDW8044487.1 sodium:proton antiporter [Nitrososphaerota archaeon]